MGRPRPVVEFSLDHDVLTSVAQQMMAAAEVEIAGKSVPVMRTGVNRLRTVRFEMDGKGYQAIEQNPAKPSRWGQLAREGHTVVQFREVGSGKYVAVVVDGKVVEYGSR
jgi:hypothetical protein